MVFYTYDNYNRLTGSRTEVDTMSYRYNAEGYRIEKTVNGEATRYPYEKDKVALETDKNNHQKAYNVYGSNRIYREVNTDTGVEGYYYVYNTNGDVTALIDQSGSIAATYDYDAFGAILSETGTADNPIRYAVYQYDKESDLYYLNARYYDSKIARFITEDTYRGQPKDPLSLNLYTYCENNPIIYYDPTGHKKKVNKVIVDGFVDENWNEYAYVQVGSQGKFTSEVEKLLRELGYIKGKSNGIYDAEESYQIELIQKKYGHRVSGVVDNKTLAYLRAEKDILEYSRSNRSEKEVYNYINWRLNAATKTPDKWPEDMTEHFAFERGLKEAGKKLALGVVVTAVAFSPAGVAVDIKDFVEGVINYDKENAGFWYYAEMGLNLVSIITPASYGVADNASKTVNRADDINDTLRGTENLTDGLKGADDAVEWTNHGYKHFPQKNMNWNDVIESTKKGPAKYNPGTDIEVLERMVWENGTSVTNGKTWKVMEFDDVIGASGGAETKYMRVEMSGGTIHGHPITRAEYLKLTK